MTPRQPKPPAVPLAGEPCSDCHHDRMYQPAGTSTVADWLCSGCDQQAGHHVRLPSCPPAPDLAEARSQRILHYEYE